MQHQLDPPTEMAPASGHMVEELFVVIQALRRGWYYIVISAVVCLVVGIVYAMRSTTSYQATARLLILEQGGRLLPGPGGAPFQAAGGNDNNSLSTHVLIIRSPIVAEQAIAKAGIKGLTVESLVDHLVVTIPDATAKVLQIVYTAGSKQEASQVIAAVIGSYEEFLKNNYQKNTGKTIELFIKARDELSERLAKMEKEYLEYREKNPSYTTDDKGLSPASRRLNQLEAEENQMRVHQFHLQSELELVRKLLGEGADATTIAAVLKGVAPLNEGIGAPQDAGDAQANSVYESPGAELERVAFQRITAARLLDHLRAELEGGSSATGVRSEEIAEAFYAEPETAKLRADLARATTRYNHVKRLSRGDDVSVTTARAEMNDLKEALASLWERRQPAISAGLAQSGVKEAIRAAEAELRTLTAKEAALREGLAQARTQRLEQYSRERDRLTREGPPNDPRARQLDEMIARLEEEPGAAAGRQADAKGQLLIGSIELGLQAVEVMHKRIREQFDKDMAEAKQAEVGMLTESNLKSDLDRQRTLFNSVVDQLNQAKLVSDFGSTTSQTLNPPSVRENRTQRAVMVLVALIVGSAMGAGMAFGAAQLDTRIRTLTEMRRALNLGVLGIVPAVGREHREVTGEIGLICHSLPRSFISEAYKTIRTNFEFIRRGHKAEVILVTSPAAGDGKSTTASNLAISLAHAGRNVLLVDADLRRPSLHGIYGTGRDRGLPHVLKDILPLHRAVRSSQVENLDLLLAGPEVPNPAELLASPHLISAIKEMRQAYDVVIVDSPPLLAVADPSILAQAVDAILLVVRTTATRRQDVERTVELLRALGAPVLGAVINGITQDEIGDRYRNAYSYAYGHAPGEDAELMTVEEGYAAATRPELTNGVVPH